MCPSTFFYISTYQMLLDCPVLCMLPRNGNLIKSLCQKLHNFMNHFKKRLVFFSKQPSRFFYHGLSQQISIWKTYFEDNVPGRYTCIANFMDRCSQNMEVVWFFLKLKPAFCFSKTSVCILLIKVSVEFFSNF